MASAKKRHVTVVPSWKRIFSVGTRTRNRLDSIVNHGVDNDEGGEAFVELEKIIRALAMGEPNPSIEVGMRGGRYPAVHSTIKSDVLNALDELFISRDKGEFDVGERGYLIVKVKRECVAIKYKGDDWEKVKHEGGETYRASQVVRDPDKKTSKATIATDTYISFFTDCVEVS